MAKICPCTGEKVLYLECRECEDRAECRRLNSASPAGLEEGSKEEICNKNRKSPQRGDLSR